MAINVGTGTGATMRRRIGAVLAAAGAMAVLQAGLAPVAHADGVQEQQWYLDAMQAEKMWEVSTGKGVKVAVVDSGLDSSTPSLRGQVLPGKDVSRLPGGTDTDKSGHGTTMAELIAGTGRAGSLKGLAPDAKVIPIRVALQGTDGKTSWDPLIAGVRAAADTDAQIISMSIGTDAPDPRLLDAVKFAANKGKLFLASAGNDRNKKNYEHFPAGFPHAVSVAATDETGKVAEYSNSASDVDIAAPGTNIPGWWCDKARKRYCDQNGGTSAATALASASAALLWSKHPDWTANQVLRVLLNTTGLKEKHIKPSVYLGHGAVRPRANLLEGKGDPGDPEISPLTNKKLGPPAKKSSGSSKSGDADGVPDKVKVADSAAGDDKGSVVLPVVGVGAGVVVLAGGGFAIARMRRKSET
ncbi:S8 family serine peptidase [Streptomyces iconiensis]|uniref:S8 family serine peptidase n=1 Tax=Streptomyces iconiensis TaxID=1384038 RepID=A0ABT6ZUZ9_9ACTN|nr:S8 family serine peptidase [Streptomyces iconiensis]MDJ1132639.1 S8 family serine peptidase [Streptomyces iconiensis]